MTKWLKMIVGGIFNLIVLVTFALILVVLSENRVVHRVLAATSGSVAELNTNRVVLKTQNAGSFVGKREPLAQDDPNEIQRTFISFRGIPYALPPIGELRWKPPEPFDLKSTPHQAADFKPPCSQWSPIKRKTIGVPDCLYLNIFIPHFPYTSKRPVVGNVSSWTVEPSNLLPVLVYIHGGEFISGSATQYSPDAILKREKCVIVTANYRLGVLGFISSGDDELPGNYGLLDQIAMLKWVKKYIQVFGGNPHRVTIYGSVEHLLLANMNDDKSGETVTVTDDLFHAAILIPQSTSVLNPFAKFSSKEGARNFLKQLGETVGCSNYQANFVNSTSYSGLIECLREADTDTLIRSQTKLLTFHNLPFGHIGANPLGPVVDDKLLIDEPEVLFSTGKFREVPIMVGLSANEGFNPFLEFYLKLYRKNKADRKDDTPEEKCDLTQILTEYDVKSLLRSILQTVMAAVPDVNKNGAFERVFQSIWNYYFGGISSKSWNTEIEHVAQKLFRLFGDMLVNTGHCELLHGLSENSKRPVYSYVFSHGMTNNRFPDFFKASRAVFETTEGMLGPKRPRRSLHMNLNTPWKETYYLFNPIRSLENFSIANGSNENEKTNDGSHLLEDIKITDALVKIWVSFAKDHHFIPRQVTAELQNYTKWLRMESGHKSLNYYHISNSPLQNGMRSDFRKAECQFWMNTVPQIRKLSKAIQDLEPFPILFWSSVAVVILFALIIITLIVLIVCVKHRTGSYGGEEIYLHQARHL